MGLLEISHPLSKEKTALRILIHAKNKEIIINDTDKKYGRSGRRQKRRG